MGLLRSKEDKLAPAAYEAWHDRVPVWVAKVSVAADPVSAPIDSWSDVIAGVEAIGWKLDTMTLTEAKGWLTAVLLFRR